MGVLVIVLRPGSGALVAMNDTQDYTNQLISETSPYLLQHAHNPVDWYPWGPEALERARREYYRRIGSAFEYLEQEVSKERIRFYGISSNSFPLDADDPEFTSLDRILAILSSIADGHHFKLIQMPFNLFEPGAVLNKNQPGGKTVLQLARENKLGVLVNRPLNAFARRRMVRLAGESAVRWYYRHGRGPATAS